jgi:hypothetical protein
LRFIHLNDKHLFYSTHARLMSAHKLEVAPTLSQARTWPSASIAPAPKVPPTEINKTGRNTID